MSTTLLIMILVTIILIGGLICGILKKLESVSVPFGAALLLVSLFYWILFGIRMPVKTTYEKISMDNIDIAVGKDKIMVTELESNKTEIFESAKIYNSFTKDKDSTFYIERKYNTYGYNINTNITKYKN